MTKRLVVAYGGSLDSAAAWAALATRLDAEPVTVTLDLGQGVDLQQVREQARTAGALRAHVVDARRELAASLIRPALIAGAFDDDPLAAAVTRPAIAAHLVAVARMEGASDVAHGASGADRVRLERLIADLAPELTTHALDGTAADEGAQVDQNLWGRTVTPAAPADPWALPASNIFTRTSEPHACAAQPAIVEITVDRGVPTAVNGVPLEIDELIEVVDTIAGDHGVGRFDRVTGASRAIVEAPAAVVLSTAIGDLAATAFDRDLLELRGQIARAYAALVDEGRWHTQARGPLDAFTKASAARLSGVVRLLLLRGACRVVGRRLTPDVPSAFDLVPAADIVQGALEHPSV